MFLFSGLKFHLEFPLTQASVHGGDVCPRGRVRRRRVRKVCTRRMVLMFYLPRLYVLLGSPAMAFWSRCRVQAVYSKPLMTHNLSRQTGIKWRFLKHRNRCACLLGSLKVGGSFKRKCLSATTLRKMPHISRPETSHWRIRKATSRTSRRLFNAAAWNGNYLISRESAPSV